MTQAPRNTHAPALLSPWRRRCQWITTLLLLLIPWFRMNGNSVLRIDIPRLSLYVFGQTLHIEELYLVLLFSLSFTLVFLLVTMVLGRVWCGWFCPQTTITDLADWAVKRLGTGTKAKPGRTSGLRKPFLHAFYLGLGFLVSANLLWYFIEPQVFFGKLISGQLHYASWIFLLLVGSIVYLDLVLVRRLMCSEFCPYGRFQTVLADQSTLALNLPPQELERCIKCNSCVRVCPMQIDIRAGYQVECINCGRCLDACRVVMAKRGQPGLISYTFGTEGKGFAALLNARTLLLGTVALVLCVTTLFAVFHRSQASLKVAVSHTAASRIIKDGSQATFFNVWISNRSSSDQTYKVVARQSGSGQQLELKGKSGEVTLAAGENRRVDLVLVTPVAADRTDVTFVLLDNNGSELANAAAQVRKP